MSKKPKSKKLWKISIYFIERSYHSGFYGITMLAKDIFEAGKLAKERYDKSDTDYRCIEIRSIAFAGELE